MRLTGFRLPRTLRYSDIAAAKLGENRMGVVVKTIDLVPRQGRQLRIIPFQYTGFYGPDGCFPADRRLQVHDIDIEPELLTHLSRAASRTEVSVKDEAQSYEAAKQDSPISFWAATGLG